MLVIHNVAMSLMISRKVTRCSLLLNVCIHMEKQKKHQTQLAEEWVLHQLLFVAVFLFHCFSILLSLFRRVMFALAIVPAGVQGILLLFFPNSPRFLVMRGKTDKVCVCVCGSSKPD